ncbi:DUF4388 domain-containing protein, partial [Calditrichota bacterium]
MLNILVVSKDRIIFDELNQEFSASNYNYEYTVSWDTAMDSLETEPKDYIFLIENELNRILETLKNKAESPYKDSIPIICFTEIISAEERSNLYAAGAFDVISLPILNDELNMLLSRYGSAYIDEDDEINSGMQGRLVDYGVLDLIQILDEGKKSAILTLIRNGTTGQIFFKDGQIYSAKYRKFSGLSAVLNIIGWLRGEFQIEFTEEEFERKIELDNQQIIIEVVQRIDARANFLKQLPPVDDIL